MNLRVWLILFMACMADVALLSLTSAPVGSFILALWYTLIGTHASLVSITVVGVFSLVQLFIVTGSVGTDLLVMVPQGLLYYYGLRMATLPRSLLAAAVFSAVLLQRFLLGGALGILGGKNEVLGALISSLTMVYLCSGSQGNRSRR
jgi:hypothetical protein